MSKLDEAVEKLKESEQPFYEAMKLLSAAQWRELQLKQKVLELCWAIEEMPASDKQTRVSVMASELFNKIKSKDDTWD